MMAGWNMCCHNLNWKRNSVTHPRLPSNNWHQSNPLKSARLSEITRVRYFSLLFFSSQKKVQSKPRSKLKSYFKIHFLRLPRIMPLAAGPKPKRVGVLCASILDALNERNPLLRAKTHVGVNDIQLILAVKFFVVRKV